VSRVDPSGLTGIVDVIGDFPARMTINVMSTIRAIGVAVVLTCALNFAVTGVLNEVGLPTGASTPCDAPKKIKGDIFFAHGTSLSSAQNINTVGVQYADALELGRGSIEPGAFYTFLVDPPPNPGLGLQLAYEWSLLKPAPHAVIIGRMPKSAFDELKNIGAVDINTPPGFPMAQVVFRPASFDTINTFTPPGRWQILVP
jgi:hypothetical protein